MPLCRPCRALLVVIALLALAGCSRGTSAPAPRDTPPPAAGPAVPPPAAPTAQATPAPAAPPPGQAGAADAGAPQAFLVRLSGVRCIAAPCPTHLAQPLGDQDAEALQIHELDFSAAGLTDAQRDAVLARMDTTPGVKLEARVGVRPKAGPAGDATVLYVTRLLEPAPAR